MKSVWILCFFKCSSQPVRRLSGLDWLVNWRDVTCVCLCVSVRCKSNCSGRGECREPNKCTCPDQYWGRHCEHQTGWFLLLPDPIPSMRIAQYTLLHVGYIFSRLGACWVKLFLINFQVSVRSRVNTGARALRTTRVCAARATVEEHAVFVSPFIITYFRLLWANIIMKRCLLHYDYAWNTFKGVQFIVYSISNYTRVRYYSVNCQLSYLTVRTVAAYCKKSCGEHGRCAALNTCRCEHGWRGRWCHKSKLPTSDLSIQPLLYMYVEYT